MSVDPDMCAGPAVGSGNKLFFHSFVDVNKRVGVSTQRHSPRVLPVLL